MSIREGYLCTDGKFFDKDQESDADEHQKKLDEEQVLDETVRQIIRPETSVETYQFLCDLLDKADMERKARQLWQALCFYRGYAGQSINKEIEEIATHLDMTGSAGGAKWVRDRKRSWKS